MEKYLYSDRKILENEAELCNDKIKDHTDCQECGEDYLFMMKDNYCLLYTSPSPRDCS